MDPKTRRLVQLEIKSGDNTQKLLDMLLGKKRAADRKTKLQNVAHRLFVDSRERPGVSHTNRTNICVRPLFIRVIPGIAKHLRPRFELRVDFKPDRWTIFHEQKKLKELVSNPARKRKQEGADKRRHEALNFEPLHQKGN